MSIFQRPRSAFPLRNRVQGTLFQITAVSVAEVKAAIDKIVNSNAANDDQGGSIVISSSFTVTSPIVIPAGAKNIAFIGNADINKNDDTTAVFECRAQGVSFVGIRVRSLTNSLNTGVFVDVPAGSNVGRLRIIDCIAECNQFLVAPGPSLGFGPIIVESCIHDTNDLGQFSVDASTGSSPGVHFEGNQMGASVRLLGKGNIVRNNFLSSEASLGDQSTVVGNIFSSGTGTIVIGSDSTFCGNRFPGMSLFTGGNGTVVGNDATGGVIDTSAGTKSTIVGNVVDTGSINPGAGDAVTSNP